MNPPAIVSVHDVMPSTLPRVRRILSLLGEVGVPPPTLLVVPGREWDGKGLSILRELAAAGSLLAGHGWIHKATEGRRSLFHRGHALLISRNEAEHLSRPASKLAELMDRCHDWFAKSDLPLPDLYVPPAWALGSLNKGHLKKTSFRWVEILRGFVECRTGRVRVLPLAGFEADTTFRQAALRVWNGVNVVAARRTGLPLRISVHPGDLDLLLAEDLKNMVAKPWHFIREGEAAGTPHLGRRP